MEAIIYRPRRVATQSGSGKAKLWVLEYQRRRTDFTDPLTGWNGDGDTNRQVRLLFSSRQSAITYAERRSLKFRIIPEGKTAIKPKSYADAVRQRLKKNGR